MSAHLPHAVGSGAIELDGRKIRVAKLSDRRHVVLDEPVRGMLSGVPDQVAERIRVRFLAADGTQTIGFEAGMIAVIAGAIADANDPADCDGEERRIALECRAFAMLCEQRGRRAMGIEGEGVLS